MWTMFLLSSGFAAGCYVQLRLNEYRERANDRWLEAVEKENEELRRNLQCAEFQFRGFRVLLKEGGRLNTKSVSRN